MTEVNDARTVDILTWSVLGSDRYRGWPCCQIGLYTSLIEFYLHRLRVLQRASASCSGPCYEKSYLSCLLEIWLACFWLLLHIMVICCSQERPTGTGRSPAWCQENVCIVFYYYHYYAVHMDYLTCCKKIKLLMSEWALWGIWLWVFLLCTILFRL